MKCTTAAEMRELDRRSIEDLGIPSLTLMEVAGRGVADLAERFVRDGQDVVVVAGSGNNGGDGYVAARHLLQRGHGAQVLLAGSLDRLSPDCAHNRRLYLDLGGEEFVDDGERDPLELLSGADLIIDALFGTGLTRAVQGRSAQIIEAINAWQVPTLAVDLPSGLDADSGQVLGAVVRADATATFAFLKRALVSVAGAQLAGDVEVIDIGIPPHFADELGVRCATVDRQDVCALLPERSDLDHKGQRGHVLVIGGSSARAGAAWLSARGALRAGAGLVTIVTSPGARQRMGAYLPELMVEVFAGGKDSLLGTDVPQLRALAAGKQALVIGPGLQASRGTRAALRELLATLPAPAVLDAEALNLFAAEPQAFASTAAPCVLTPHPGEMARLLGCSVAEVQRDRFASVAAAAERAGQAVLLKGAHSVVASPQGELRVIPVACSTLATAGSGDTLAGVIAALLARGLGAFDAAWLGAWLHAQAGLRLLASLGDAALATEIADELGRLLCELRRVEP